jgi:hypothetical protein
MAAAKLSRGLCALDSALRHCFGSRCEMCLDPCCSNHSQFSNFSDAANTTPQLAARSAATDESCSHRCYCLQLHLHCMTRTPTFHRYTAPHSPASSLTSTVTPSPLPPSSFRHNKTIVHKSLPFSAPKRPANSFNPTNSPQRSRTQHSTAPQPAFLCC